MSDTILGPGDSVIKTDKSLCTYIIYAVSEAGGRGWEIDDKQIIKIYSMSVSTLQTNKAQERGQSMCVGVGGSCYAILNGMVIKTSLKGQYFSNNHRPI